MSGQMIHRKFNAFRLLQAKKKLKKGQGVAKRILSGPLKDYSLWFTMDTDNAYVLGNYESHVIPILKKYVQPGFAVYDCGAHQGYFAMTMGKMVGPEGHIHSFEALPSNYKVLEKNLKLNQVTNITAMHCAIGNADGTVQFSDSGNSFANTLVQTSSVFANHAKVEVPIGRLDQLQKENNLPMPDFIKMDIEGAELEGLMGVSEILKKAKPFLHIATHDIHKPGVHQACIDLLTDLGYIVAEEFPHQGHELMSDVILTHPDRS